MKTVGLTAAVALATMALVKVLKKVVPSLDAIV